MTYPCRYRSVGDATDCCPDLNKELGKYEHGVLYDSDDEYTDNSSDDEFYGDEPGEKTKGARKQWVDNKRRLMVQFCESDCFKVSIMTAIFLNTVTMAMEHYRQVTDNYRI